MDSNNLTNLNSNVTDFSSAFIKTVLPVFYCLIFAGGLILNCLAALIFFRIPSNTSFIIYLKNIVVADLLMTLTFPFKIVNDFGSGGWRMRVIVCRYTAVVFYMNMYVGITFLGLISLERYLKIVRSSGASVMQNVTYARVICAATWCLLIFFNLPNSILTSKEATEETSWHCVRLKTELGVQWHKVTNYFSVSIFWAVFLLMGFCYASITKKIYDSYQKCRRDRTETRKKSNRNIFSILVVFFICFVPYHACRISYTLSQTAGSFSAQSKFVLFHLKESTLMLSALNVCLDPVIYFLMCKLFRELLLERFSEKSTEMRRKSVSYSATTV
ncbi:P2Y14 protein, partial [Atractosteus spatula]|nr:P2Y14 protein [Atractosteus spatula]